MYCKCSLVGPDVMTNFYVGVWSNKEQMKENVLLRICHLCPWLTLCYQPDLHPHFEIYFEASYGLNRDKLEELNYLIKTSPFVNYNPTSMVTAFSILSREPGLTEKNRTSIVFNIPLDFVQVYLAQPI
jgi:hypothetical protein